MDKRKLKSNPFDERFQFISGLHFIENGVAEVL